MNDSYVIFAGYDALRVGRLGDGDVTTYPPIQLDGAELADCVDDVRRQMAEAGYAEQDVVLALASSWCLSATISSEGLDRAARKRGLAFRLEEHLPISAEDVVAGYIAHDRGQALGVCCETQKLQAVITALEAAGIRIGHICPAAFLVAAHVAQQHPGADAVLLADGEAESLSFDLIEMHNGKPERWWWLADDAMALRHRLDTWLDQREGPTRLVLSGCDVAILGEIVRRPSLQTVEMPAGHHQPATLHAANVLQHVASPWIDLRDGVAGASGGRHLHRRPALTLTVAMAALLLCVSGVMQWRGRQYAGLTTEYVHQQADVFKSAMPNQRVPGSIQGRLLSERRRLAGLSEQGTEGANAALHTTSALAHLREILKSLPSDLRFRITDLNIQPDLIRITGQARSHAEAATLAAAIRQTGRYEADAPQTGAIGDQGVSFAFTARPVAGGPLAKGAQP